VGGTKDRSPSRSFAAAARIAVLFGAAVHAGAAGARAAPGEVLSHQKISQIAGGFAGTLADFDSFGRSAVSLGDVDGNGALDLAVGAPGGGDTGDLVKGAVWIVFLDLDGSVLAHQKVSDTDGGFTGALDNGDAFGSSLAALGDLNADGVPDLAVGAPGDDDGDPGDLGAGATWILFLNPDGTVEAHQKISETAGGFGGSLEQGDSFGASLAGLGRLSADGSPALAVGAPGDDTAGDAYGAVWILFLSSAGVVQEEDKISRFDGCFNGSLDDFDAFGSSLASLGDLDGDSTPDLAVGAPGDDDGGTNRGAVYLLMLYEPMVASRASRRSAIPREASPASCTAGTTSGRASRRSAISTATAFPTSRSGRHPTTTGARCVARSGTSSSTPRGPSSGTPR
jgi:hypothetical protein